MATITTITFEDHGQDFLEWDIDESDTVVGCRPFQSRAWVGSVVLNKHPLEVGDKLTLQVRSRAEPYHLAYPIEAIQRGVVG